MSNPQPPGVVQHTTTAPSKSTLTLAPGTSTPSSTNPASYLFLLLLLAVVLLLTTFYIVSRRHRARALAARHAGVRALALDVEALANPQHPRTLSPSTPLPPRGWRFARLLRLPMRRRVVDEDADWELDVDEVGRAPPPYGGEVKDLTGLPPAYEEVCDGGRGDVGVLREGRMDEVSPRSPGEGVMAADAVTVPERVIRRGSEGDWRGSRSRDRDEGRRGASF
ncbi:hypothetical protein V494_00892 [Pseudogymnoascus sp. VKM F-4513 (FW-928)]|nr:hypothetical protein V494_00892 [Pseudogymnoascus sp. VKM F-4513 (FW-928)]